MPDGVHMQTWAAAPRLTTNYVTLLCRAWIAQIGRQRLRLDLQGGGSCWAGAMQGGSWWNSTSMTRSVRTRLRNL